MANLFNSVQLRKPKRNMIPLNYQNLLTTSFGKLTPAFLEECIPGDIFRIRTEIFTRFQPLLSPVMDRANVSLHFFFVPSRILYKDFYSFLTGEDDQAVVPYAEISQLETAQAIIAADLQRDSYVGQLSDYLNLPTDKVKTAKTPFSLLPVLAYQRIWYEYYRDENLQDADDILQIMEDFYNHGGRPSDDNTLVKLLSLHYRSYKKDYFTSALPFAQKGDDVLLPLQDSPIFTQISNAYTGAHDLSAVFSSSNRTSDYLAGSQSATLYADNRSLAPSINDIRTSFRVQELVERNARGGTRQQEFNFAHFGVYGKDSRLQRPEYIGGSTTPIQISEVLSQAALSKPGEQDYGLGQLGGHAVSAGVCGTKKYRVTEHGYIMGIISVMPHASYFQGLPRFYSHLDKYDFFFPTLANLGEQEIKQKELFVGSLTDTELDATFGYTPRYAEYKYHPDEVHGDFRESLSYWHMGRIFDDDNVPALNEEFITVNPESGVNRIFNYSKADFDQILIQLYHHNKALRLMPYFGNPKF